jgi:hypothetical protein
MSFILQDHQLLDKLLFYALEHQLKFTKQGQDLTANRDLLLRHLQDLQAQLKPTNPNAGPAISYKGSTALGSPQLESLGDLIQWLATNESKIDGQIIAYPTKPSDDEQYIPYKLETHITTLQQRGQEPGTLYVNPSLLQKYIVYLQATEAQHPNLIMQKQLSFIIKDANQTLGLQINPVYQVPPKVLPDTTVLDNLPQTFNPAAPYQGGTIPITYADVKDATTLNAWLTRNNIGFQVDPQKAPVKIQDPTFDIKSIVRSIIQRATLLASRAPDLQTKEHSEIYARQANQIATQVSGDVTTESSSNSPTNPTAQKPSTLNADQATLEAVQTLPFASRDINFDRIRSFFEKVQPALGHDPRVIKLINDTTQLMQQVNSRVTAPDIFPMGLRPADFVRQFKNQQTPGSEYYGILKNLAQIINNTRMVAEYFWYQKGSKLSNQRSYFMGQIGETPEDDSLYNQNMESLQDLNRVAHQ